jgi:hypothetical protein
MIIKLLVDIVLILLTGVLTIFSLGSAIQIQSILEDDTKVSHKSRSSGIILAYVHLFLAFLCGLSCLINFYFLVIDLSKLVC